MPPIVYIDHSEIRSGAAEALQREAEGLVAFVREREPRILSYGFYLDEAANRLAVVGVYPDPAALKFHMEVAGPAFRPFADLLRLRAIEVYGSISEKSRRQLEAKAALLGPAEVRIAQLSSGLDRLH